MKLATLDNLTENFVDTLDEEEEEVDPLAALADEAPEVDDLEATGDVAPLEVEGPAVDVDPETVEALVGAIADAIGDVTGVDVSVEGGEPPAEEVPMDAGAELEAELGSDVEPLEGADELEEGDYAAKQEDDDLEEGRQIPADLVEELTRRVAARLVREAKK